ncbi:hypothetical protein [Luteimonas salinilitoris]|uniref:Uncharacterized protein n=1 Tax=Luteimonas salinilitoris TaxID=3237697 RepID=A0ABV4HV67_9GAMM
MMFLIEVEMNASGNAVVNLPLITLQAFDEVIWFSQPRNGRPFQVVLEKISDPDAPGIRGLLEGTVKQSQVGGTAKRQVAAALKSLPVQAVRFQGDSSEHGGAKLGYRILPTGSKPTPDAPYTGVIAMELLAGTSGGVQEPTR